MATTQNSKIIICRGIKLDKDYNNVLNYTPTEMLNVCNSNTYFVASADTYSFIRNRGTILVDFPYYKALECNYMAFQNYYYALKWFFAFIDDVHYVNDGTVEIEYTIDVWTTYFSDINIGQSFVLREHTNNDTIGANTVPEDIETGEFICNSHYKDTTMDSYASDLCFIMASTSEPLARNCTRNSSRVKSI